MGGLSTHSVKRNGVLLSRPTEWVDCQPTLLGMEQLLFRPERVGGLSTHSVGRNGVLLFRPPEWVDMSTHSVRDGTVTVPFLTEWVDCPPTLLGMEQLLFRPNRLGGLSAHSVGRNGVVLFRPTEWVDCRPTR